MSTQKKRLGKGLEALLGPSSAAAFNDAATPITQNTQASHEKTDKVLTSEGVKTLPVDQLKRGQFQPRKDMRSDSLNELADSIKAQGIIQPILVRPVKNARVPYEIVAGERRWRAAQLAGLHEVPVVIKTLDDTTTMAVALIENIQREDLNAIEEARALKRLIDDCNLTHEQVGESVGRSRSSVTNLLRLLELSSDVQQALMERRINMGHARALATLTTAQQSKLCKTIVAKGLSVRATESLVKNGQVVVAGKTTKANIQAKDPDVLRLENDLSDHLGAKVELKTSAKGRGQMVIHYNSLDELDGLMAHMKS